MDIRTPPTELPVSLRLVPLVEAVFELRFEPARPFTGEVLPGLLQNQLSERFPQIEQLPIASLPREIREGDPGLRYQPHMKLLSEQGETVLVGHRSLAISKTPPYPGWATFRESLIEITTAARTTELLGPLIRYSFKCTNIFDQPTDGVFSPLKVSIKAADYVMKEFGRRARFEIEEHGFSIVVEVISDATVSDSKFVRKGLLLTIDTLRQSDAHDFWRDASREIDAAHEVTKRTFFQLLQPKTLESLGPVWQEVKV